MSLKWDSKPLLALTEEVVKKAIDATTEEAAQNIVRGRWWQAHVESGLVSEVVTEPARRRGVEIVGKVGTTKRRGFYGLFLEREQPFIRPGADEAFPHVLDRLRAP